jgi:protein-arginine kinase activator protein McsA
VPIYTVESIMSEAGILLSDISTEESSAENIPTEKKVRKPKQTKEKDTKIENLSNEQLKTMLEEALKNEDYENAARLRDELNKRN